MVPRPGQSAGDTAAGPPAGEAIIRAIPTHEEVDMADKPMKDFAGLYYREGALDPKTMQLVALAAMAAAGCTS
jgi:alkylhydroperoxidase/carboxymuconolactone decarboxylase family protein YurZ